MEVKDIAHVLHLMSINIYLGGHIFEKVFQACFVLHGCVQYITCFPHKKPLTTSAIVFTTLYNAF